jgi:flagellar basal-body rod protein FlgB
MLGRIERSLQFQSEALQLRAQRQQILSANIANADTPGYKAVDFDFARALRESTAL